MVAATVAASVGQGRGLLDPPWLSSFSVPFFAVLLARALLLVFQPDPKRKVPTRVCFLPEKKTEEGTNLICILSLPT